jgi:hypothetical protein
VNPAAKARCERARTDTASPASGAGLVAEPHFELLAPLRHRSFAVLWSSLAAAYMAQYIAATTAQWYLVTLPGGEPHVPLVQLALTLPMTLWRSRPACWPTA